MRTAQATLLLLSASLLAGCNTRPRAPALRDDPVYQNDREGFRFLAPEGWTQAARTEVPPGKVKAETPLVDYRRTKGEGRAALRVSLADLPDSTDLGKYLAGPSYGVDKWAPAGPPEEVSAGSATGTRYAFSGRVGKEEVAKEVVAVRRGGRVYFFAALYAPKDVEVRDQLRRVVSSVVWK
jgi:hypothetical protein